MSKTYLNVQRQDVGMTVDDLIFEEGRHPKIEYELKVEIDVTTLSNGDKRVLIETVDDYCEVTKVAEIIMKRVPNEEEKEAETKRCLELGLVGKDDLAGYDSKEEKQ